MKNTVHNSCTVFFLFAVESALNMSLLVFKMYLNE